MSLEERYVQKRLGFIKFCLNEKYEISFDRIFVNRVQKQVSIQADIVITTNTNGSLKHHKYTKMQRFEDIIGKWTAKK